MATDKIMTVGRLAKLLNNLVEDGNERRPVAVFKDTLDTGNDTFNVCDVYKAAIEAVNICDDDGFTTDNYRATLVLRGRWWDQGESGVGLLERQIERLENELKCSREHLEAIKAQRKKAIEYAAEQARKVLEEKFVASSFTIGIAGESLIIYEHAKPMHGFRKIIGDQCGGFPVSYRYVGKIQPASV